MNRVYPTGDEPARRATDAPLAPTSRDPSTIDTLLREARRLLASRSYAEVVRKLEVHRPAEWAAIDGSGVRLVRLLGQAHLGLGDLRTARDCLEHVRSAEGEKSQLSRDELASALSDLYRCYCGLELPELAADCLSEARRLQRGG